MINYLELGGTLFIPASHKDLNTVINHKKYSTLKSLVIDFEDSLDDSLVLEGEYNLKNTLNNIDIKDFIIFIRPRNQKHLKKLLNFDNIDRIDGFLLAKFSLLNANAYLDTLKDTNFFIMPSIEGSELFNINQLIELKEILLTNKHKIVLVRFGLEDMLKHLKIGRDKENGVFDISATSFVLGAFISTFKSVGFAISGGVYPYFKNNDGFIKDIKSDLKEGLFSKTIIHPNQIDLCNESYKVTQEEFDEAVEISNAVTISSSTNYKMIEPKTMSPYFNELLQRAEIYGIKIAK